MIHEISQGNQRLRKFYRRLSKAVSVDFIARGIWLFRVNRGVLSGLVFEPSHAFTPNRWLWRFAVPLWIPLSDISLSLGWRIPLPDGNRGVSVNPDDKEEFASTVDIIHREALPWLQLIQGPKVIPLLVDREYLWKNIYHIEYNSTAFAILGEVEESMETIQRLFELLDAKVLIPTFDAEIEAITRMNRLFEQLKSGSRSFLDDFQEHVDANLEAYRLYQGWREQAALRTDGQISSYDDVEISVLSDRLWPYELSKVEDN